MSPEQVIGRDVDGRADIYSLGAVLYEMLTGLPPFAGSDLDTVFIQVVNETPPAPSSRNKSIAAVFDYIVAKAMAKDADDRYGSALAMASDLRKFRDFAIWRPKGETFLPLYPVNTATTPDNASSLPAAATENTSFLQRRNLVVYGVPAALLAALAGWAVLSKRASDRTQSATNQGHENSSPGKVTGVNPGSLEIPRQDQERVEAPAPSQPRVPADTVPSVTKQTPAVAKRIARLALAITPWGEVYVDGRKKGISPPLAEIKLAPGKHVVEIRNSAFQPYVKTVELAANGHLKIKHKFQ
jgi:serine/threonine-protein kinase